MVLTVQATEVAPGAGNRETFGARVEMIEGFFLYGVDGQRAGLAIHFAIKHAVTVAPAAADACLAVGYAAMVRAKLAFHRATVQLLKIITFHGFFWFECKGTKK